MNKEGKNRDMQAIVMLPEDKFRQIISTVTSLAEHHLELIGLYEKESRLKKQHKPYLYVREHADEVCRRDKKLVSALVREVLDPESIRIVDPDEINDGESTERENSRNHTETEGTEREACEKQDNFALPEGLVLMSTETLGMMQDDMLLLTEALDQVLGILRAGVNGHCVRRADAETAVRKGAHLSEEVFKRWDSADFAAFG